MSGLVDGFPPVEDRSLTPQTGHAIVIGASLAGLLAARVLRRHFARVTVVERDVLPESPTPRRGVPQANHNHVLLLRGRNIVEALFPGFQDAVVADGAVLLDMARDLAWLTPWGWGVRFASPLVTIACSRALLEWRLRHMLAAMPRVTFRTGVAAEGLHVEHGRVRGIRADGERLDGDLVVDASGRGSRAPQWLQETGFRRPVETVVDASLGYASRFYRPTAEASRSWRGMYVQAAPPDHPRVGVIVPIEKGLWHVTLGGGDRQYPPGDERGFSSFAASLRSPALHEALGGAEPCSPIYVTRSTENRRRHFESVRMPEGLVVTGDAACAFNPVYGQGMTTAAIAAETLDACLEATGRRTGMPHGNGLATRFQRALSKAQRAPWTLATGEDLRYRCTTGARAGFATRAVHQYMDMVGRLAAVDPAVRLRMLHVFHMIAPAHSLFAPSVLWRVLRNRGSQRVLRGEHRTGVRLLHESSR